MITSSEIDVKEPATVYQLSFKKDAATDSHDDEVVALSQIESYYLLEGIIRLAGGQDNKGNIRLKNISPGQVKGMILLANQRIEDVIQNISSELRNTPIGHLSKERSLKELILVRRLIIFCMVKPLLPRNSGYRYLNIVKY